MRIEINVTHNRTSFPPTHWGCLHLWACGDSNNNSASQRSFFEADMRRERADWPLPSVASGRPFGAMNQIGMTERWSEHQKSKNREHINSSDFLFSSWNSGLIGMGTITGSSWVVLFRRSTRGVRSKERGAANRIKMFAARNAKSKFSREATDICCSWPEQGNRIKSEEKNYTWTSSISDLVCWDQGRTTRMMAEETPTRKNLFRFSFFPSWMRIFHMKNAWRRREHFFKFLYAWGMSSVWSGVWCILPTLMLSYEYV